ncbi:MAG: hypothetical protein GY854_28595, partial [Deltaproteobacteria bacterium]|nr:hypothetical protein [Deltaproteobacteria bacterium]
MTKSAYKVLLPTLVLGWFLNDAPAAAAVPELFPITGLLTDEDGAPLDGEYDVTFAIYSGRVGGSSLWSETRSGEETLRITGGLFAAYLEIGPEILIENDELWLGITVGSGKESERSRLGTSLFAAEAQVCRSVAGVSCGEYEFLKGWDGGEPICARVDIETGPGSTLDADLFDGLDSADFADAHHHHDAEYLSRYRRTIVVSPVGDDSANGDALLAALSSITDASSTNRYLISIEPGTYELREAGGAAPALELKEWIDVAGSTQEATRIVSCGSEDPGSGTVVGQANTGLRDVTVENTGTCGTYSVAIGSYSPGLARYTKVTAVAASPTFAYAFSSQSSSVQLTSVTARATSTGSGSAFGIRNVDTTATIVDTVSEAISDAGTATGLSQDNASTQIRGGSFSATILSGSAAGNAHGLRLSKTKHSLHNVKVSATGGASTRGILIESADVNVFAGAIAAMGQGAEVEGVAYLPAFGAGLPYTVLITNSTINDEPDNLVV